MFRILHTSLTSFPGGRAGVGLLLLRISLGTQIACVGWNLFRPVGGSDSVDAFSGVLAFLCAAGFFLGYQSLLCSIAVLVSGLAGSAGWIPALSAALGRAEWLFPTLTSAALAFLGPGAFSLDARRFGRREIIIPKRADDP